MRAEWQIRNFRNYLVECGLQDLGFSGAPFTWCNKQLAHTPSKNGWIELALARVLHAKSPYSDHAPLIIELRPKVQWDLSGCKKCFQFEAASIKELECEAIIFNSWSVPGSSQTERRLSEKLAFVSARLSCWGRLYGREARERINVLERLLVARNNATLTNENRSRALKERAELTKLIIHEEIFWKQHNKDLWLKEGYRNSSFFHAKASHRHKTNSIRWLRTLVGSLTELVEGVKRCILEYFEGVHI
ncbi:UNVERIFIED_CONTAM: hypothetical protein Slati_2346600 [Sesamum latifolium]|uniref:Reverse transcriptase n=1 Tax=Sesamum latifolium TaxID=2727402 RepID=A0AAW2WBF7_9LAMI